MARYAKVDRRIWNDARFTSLSERGKLVFLFLLTHPTLTMLGAMRATEPGLAAELGLTPEAFGKAFKEALSEAIVKHDSRASFLWLPNFLKYNRPESPNVVRAWPDALDLIPECALKSQLFEQLKTFIEGLSKGFREAFAEAFPEGYAESVTGTVTGTEEKTPVESFASDRLPGKADQRSARISIPDSTVAEIYRTYPRHEAPGRAKAAIRKAIARVSHAEQISVVNAAAKLLERTETYAAKVKREGIEAKFIPYPGTWFNGENYEGESATKEQPAAKTKYTDLTTLYESPEYGAIRRPA